ncbi:MAG TPA: hypothetical protein P5056_04220 [Candidatus Paceibacterota bacterium]|nr:hypothetical protein [Candidatus Paceibacterota bacterium]
MNYTKEQLNNIFENLPSDIQNAIYSVESADAVESIGKKYSLHMDQIAALGRETGRVLLGITDPMDFVNQINEKLGVGKTVSSQLVFEINEKIFVPIKDSLRQIHSQAPMTKPAPVPAPNVVKNISTMELNVPKKTMDVLQGNIQATPRGDKTEILGFSAEKKEMQAKTEGQLNIMEEKMKGGFNIPKAETEISKREPSRVVDPYREPI